MSARDDLTRATDEARAQVRAARETLARSRDATGGGPAKDVTQAEAQLDALRDAIAGDLRQLRDRVTGLDPAARRSARRWAAIISTGWKRPSTSPTGPAARCR